MTHVLNMFLILALVKDALIANNIIIIQDIQSFTFKNRMIAKTHSPMFYISKSYLLVPNMIIWEMWFLRRILFQISGLCITMIRSFRIGQLVWYIFHTSQSNCSGSKCMKYGFAVHRWPPVHL